MWGLGAFVTLVAAVGVAIAYLVFDPAGQSCHAQIKLNPNLICPRHGEFALVVTLMSVAVITLFGTLAIRGGQDAQGGFTEGRIRLAIAMSLLVLYIVFFSMAVFWAAEGTNQKMIETLTNLMMVVMPFYFGASAVAQVNKNKEAPK
jgi:hypothetical protein